MIIRYDQDGPYAPEYWWNPDTKKFERQQFTREEVRAALAAERERLRAVEEADRAEFLAGMERAKQMLAERE